MRPFACMPTGLMRCWRVVLALVLVAGVFAPGTLSAAPAAPSRSATNHRAIPDWLSLAAADRLNLGFPVLLPDAVPAPLSGEPAITADDGYYSLYWVIPGSPPTFLQITGEVGGTIPDYSKYDRNNQLEQNAAVSGSPAYHDLTPIYDLVYWQIDDVVYSVESRNLDGTDSLTIANDLSVLNVGADSNPSSGQAGSATVDAPQSIRSDGVVQIAVDGGTGATLTVDYGYFTANGDESIELDGNAVEWHAPEVDHDLSVSFSVTDSNGASLASAGTLVVADTAVAAEATTTLALACPETVAGGSRMRFTLTGSGNAILDAGAGAFPAESPNTDFAPEADGGKTMVGTVPDSGEIELVWVAPEVDQEQTVYLFASTEAGETPGECDIQVTPAGRDAGASGDAEVGNSSDPTKTDAEQFVDSTTATAVDEPTVAATKTPKRAKATRTPKGYSEVIGLPTAIPLDDGTGAGDGRLLPTPTVPVTATPRPSPTFAPTTGENGMMAQTIGPDGGELESPLGITVVIPKGALTEPVTLSIQPVAQTQLPTSSDVSLVAATGFDVAIASSNGLAVTNALKKPAEVRIDIDKATDAAAIIYRIDGSRLIPLTNTRREKNVLIVSVTEFSRFAAGVPTATTVKTNKRVLPFVLAAVVVTLTLIGMVVLGSLLRPRRQRIIVSRRPTRRPFR